MKVKMKTGMSGFDVDGNKLDLRPGDIGDFDTGTANRLIDSDQAEAITPVKKKATGKHGAK